MFNICLIQGLFLRHGNKLRYYFNSYRQNMFEYQIVFNVIFYVDQGQLFRKPFEV